MHSKPARIALTALPPLGALGSALALVDLTAYSVFLRGASGWSNGAPQPQWFVSLGASLVVALLAAFPKTRAWAWPLGLALAGWLLYELLGARQEIFAGNRLYTCCDVACPYPRDEWTELQALGALAVLGVGFASRTARNGRWEWLLLVGGSTAVLALCAQLGVLFTIARHDVERAGPVIADALELHAVATCLLVALGAVLLLRRALLEQRAGTRGAVFASALGLLAFVATRPLAFDARHALPFVEEGGGVALDLPKVVCEPPEWGPELTVGRGHVEFDAQRWELGQTERLAAKIADVKKKYEEVRDASGGGARMRPWTVAIESSTRMADVIPILGVLRAEGFTGLKLQGDGVVSTDSWTRGPLERRGPCQHAFRLRAGGAPASWFSSWEDFARATVQGVYDLDLDR